ncbi:hypothetical protein [Dendrosporobacter sp. 1207_IL3150]|uniref:hypothetical protein n=1 Tax=Dendrosporobacter sp. 1207_IL3150 TaxID=3084054 RepID=UPI002FD93F9F
MATPILNTIIADVNAIVPNLTSIVSSYRLLVGSAEEISRTPGVPFEVFERAVIRYDRTGTLIDILLELLCCKIKFLAEFLSVTCAPIDIFSLAQDPVEETTVEQIIELEVLRRILKTCCYEPPCFCPPVQVDPSCIVPCPKPAAPAPATTAVSTEPIPPVAATPTATTKGECFTIDSEVLKDILIQAGLIIPVQDSNLNTYQDQCSDDL